MQSKMSTRYSNQNRLPIVYMVITGIVSVVLIIGAFVSINNTQREHKNNLIKIAKLSEELNRVKNVKILTEKKANERVNSAFETGNMLASIQNKYNSISSTDDKALQENLDKAGRLIEQDAQGARAQWLIGTDKCTWKLETNYPYPSQTFPVVFTGHDKEGKLLGMVVCSYNSKIKKFKDFRIYLTPLAISITSVPDEIHDGKMAEDPNKLLDEYIEKVLKEMKESEANGK